MTSQLLVGNTFPASLITVPVTITPITMDDVIYAMGNSERLLSFWGHTNTISIVNKLTGYDVTPSTERPALEVGCYGQVGLNGFEFSELYTITPLYKEGFRPQIGQELTPEDIVGWTTLHYQFEPTVSVIG